MGGSGLMWMDGSEILDVTWYSEVLMTVTARWDGGCWCKRGVSCAWRGIIC
jgi:hypothetical protein